MSKYADPRNCTVCGATFRPQSGTVKRGNGLTCSHACGHKWRSQCAATKTQKTCRQCKTVKPVTEFFKQSQGRAGYRSYCKACNRRVSEVWTERNKERARRTNTAQIKRWRETNPERWKEIQLLASRRYKAAHPERYRENQAKALMKHRELHPEKYAAKQAVLIATRAGRLIRRPCEICGEPKTHGHYDDYSKPLSVRWLCQKHHVEHHRNQRRAL